MKKKLLLLLAALATLTGFNASAAVGDVITDGTFYFNIVAEGDVNEVEFAPKPTGTYTITNRSIFGNYNTVTIGGVTYNVVGIGEGAFRNAQFPTQNITNLPTELRYISDYAFQGVKSGTVDDSDSNIRFYGNIQTVSPLAFIDNEIVGTINVSNGTENYKQVACTASRIQYNSNNCYAPCKDGNTLIAIGGKGKVLGNGSGGYKCANKLTLASDFTIVGPHAMHGNQAYTQLDLGNVVEIQEYAFKNSAVQQLTLPATLTTVDPTAFEGATAIFTITCNATTPPAGCVFDDAVYASIRESGRITVPEEALDAYKADANWGKFWAAPAEAPKMYIAGTFTEWANGKLEMTENEGVYSITVNGITDGAEFKFIEGDEDPVWYGGDAEGDTYGVHSEWCTDIPLSATGQNFKISGGGDLTFTVSADKKLTVTGWAEPANELYLAGSMTDWANGKEAMTLDEQTGKFSITKEMAAGAEFKFIDQDGAWIGGDADGNFIVNEAQVTECTELSLILNGGNNFQIPVAGTWMLTVDKATMKLVISGEWPAPKYAVSIDENIANGSVVADKAEAEEGEIVTLTVTPAEGYQLKSVTVTPETLELLVEVNENNEFTMPADNVTVTAEFEEIPPVTSVITFNAAPEHGAMTVKVGGNEIESGAEVAEGTEVTVVLTPENGYKVGAFTVETVAPEGGPSDAPRRASVPVAEGEDNTFTFEMPGEPVTLNASFVEDVVTAIRDLRAAGYEGVIYIDVMGRVSSTPFNGVNIVIDGTKVTKMVK